MGGYNKSLIEKLLKTFVVERNKKKLSIIGHNK